MLTFYIFAADKDIYVLTYIALLGKDTVSKGGVFGPEILEDSLDRREILFKSHLGLAVRERF